MKKNILVVVDMQNDFVNGPLGTLEAEQILPAVCEKIKNFDGDIYVTKDTHTEDYMNTQEGKNLPVVHCIKGTKGWELHDKVMEALTESGKDYQVFEKPTFGSTDLAESLLKLNDDGKIESITFIGICTGICVISNAMLCKAYMPEVPLSVDAKCCACVTPQSHENAIDAMRLCQIKIV